jgi:hypothetical protein
MATNNLRFKGQAAAAAKQLIAGAEKHLANTTQIVLSGSLYTPAQVTAKLQQVVTLRNDVDAAKASTKTKVAVEKAESPALRTFMSALVTYVKAAYGTSPDVLADFGVHAPKQHTPLTVEAKTAAAAKRAATRAARHTMSPKKKKAVKGDVTGIVVTAVSTSKPTVTTQPSVPTPSSPSDPAASETPTTAKPTHAA